MRWPILRWPTTTWGSIATLGLLLAGCSAGSGSGSQGGSNEVGGRGGETTSSGGSLGTGGAAVGCAVDCASVVVPACRLSVCNEDTGNCEVVDADDGSACDDGAFCTTGDACLSGLCIGGAAQDCGLAPSPCEDVICDEETDTCSLETRDNGATCDATDLCLVNTICDDGECIGDPNECFLTPLDNECHRAACNPSTGICESMPDGDKDGSACVDPSDLCSVGNTCLSGTCQGGMPKDCSLLSQGCFVGLCDVTGTCQAQPLMVGDRCDDKNGCTTGEICNGTSCGGGTPITSCISGDDCCAPGCTAQNDSDCGLDILLLGDDVADPVDWDSYRNAVAAAGETWAERNLDLLPFPTAAELAGYNVIVLFDESLAAYGDAECQRLADWLQGGPQKHHLFATSIDLVNDWATAPAGSGERNLVDLFGVTFVATAAGTVDLAVVASDALLRWQHAERG
ncbi:MAG: hypothetical protein KC731_05030, partial [Myxococcales bacterium]|nr:hypothetical protein [Myxococcales bacterium]